MDLNRELIRELSGLFAEDLNAAMGRERSPERIVLFFDTHEAFYGRNRSFEDDFFLDEWLRRLLRRLDTELGIVVVVAGRDKPRWAEARENTHIPTDHVQLESVDDLVESDAKIFLQQAGVTDAALQESLIRYASVEAGRVHPLYLGLCADVVLEAAVKRVALVPGDFSERKEFREKSVDLIKRLLFYVDDGLRDAIRALSACRAFNFEIYRLLGEKLSFAVDRATFRKLVGFSFVRQVAQQGNEWFRIHDLVRRLEDDSEATVSHQILAEHYRLMGGIEVIYHLNQLDWMKGVAVWEKVFEEYLELGRYELCRVMLDLRQELSIKAPFERGIVYSLEGQYLQNMGLNTMAETTFVKAIAAYDENILTFPNNAATYNNKGNVLTTLADSQARQFNHGNAIFNYRKAIDSFNQAVRSDSNFIAAYSNNAAAWKSLGDLQAKHSSHHEAFYSYGKAVASCDTALSFHEESADANNNRGLAIQSLGDLQATLFLDEIALSYYRQAIATYSKVIQLSPKYVKSYINKGVALENQGVLHSKKSCNRLAASSYREAILIYDEALHHAPGHIYINSNKAGVLLNLGQLQLDELQYEDAERSYTTSIKIYDKILEKAPNFVHILNRRSVALASLGSFQCSQSRLPEGLMNFRMSLLSIKRSLDIEPDNQSILQARDLLTQLLSNLES